MAKQELLVEVKKLISIGKEGVLTYDELNSTLPAEVVRAVRQHYDDVYEMDIEIVDARKVNVPKKRSAAPNRGGRRRHGGQ